MIDFAEYDRSVVLDDNFVGQDVENEATAQKRCRWVSISSHDIQTFRRMLFSQPSSNWDDRPEDDLTDSHDDRGSDNDIYSDEPNDIISNWNRHTSHMATSFSHSGMVVSFLEVVHRLGTHEMVNAGQYFELIEDGLTNMMILNFVKLGVSLKAPILDMVVDTLCLCLSK